MSVASRIREKAVEWAVTRVVKMAQRGARGKNFERRLGRMLRLAAFITRDPLWSAVVQGVHEKLRNGHPAIGVARRLLTRMNPNVRKNIVGSLIVHETLLGAAKRHAIEDAGLGYYPPSFFVVSPSMYCNLKCYGCYASEYDPKEQLSFEEMDDLMNQAKDLGMYFCVISGGEPYCYKPLLDVFEKHRDMTFQTYTAGMHLTDAVVDRLAELGNVVPCISCEGFEAETDRRRGKGAFKKVIRAMHRLREKGIVFGFSATVTCENAEVISSEKFIDFYSEQGCLIGWYFQYIPIGRSPVFELMATPEQRAMVGRRVRRWRECKEIFLVDFWNDGEHAGGCIAGGRKYFHVNNRGDVEPCVFCHFASDNLREKPLREILGSGIMTAIRKRQPYHEDLRRPCMLIDNPHVLRDVVAETDAYPTHPGAESLITKFAEPLDEYAKAFGEVLKDEEKSTWTMHI